MEWTREKTLKLLNEYKNRRILWDCNIRDFRDRTKRRYAIIELAELFCCNTLEIEKKITNLKCQYSREVQKIQTSIDKSTSPNDIHVSKWFAFKSMEFLQSGTKRFSLREKKPEEKQQEEEYIKPKEENLEEDYIISDIDSENLKFNNCNNDTTISTAGSSDIVNQNSILLASQVHNIPTNNENNEFSINKNAQDGKIKNENIDNDDVDIDDDNLKTIKEEYIKFGESIACQLAQIPDSYSRSVAKLKINQILFEAEIGSYAQGNS